MIIGWKETGTYHIAEGLPCQDAFSSAEHEGTAAIALSDGAGSYPHSEIASTAVSEALSKYAASHFDELYTLEDADLKKKILSVARETVEAENPGMHAKCTLLLFASRHEKSFLMHIGDGGAIAVNEEGSPLILSYPENGDSPNITFFLDGVEAERHLRLKRDLHDHLSSLLLCSDGVYGSLFDVNGKTIAPAVGIMDSWLRSGNQEAAEEKLRKAMRNIFAENTADDVSIIMQSFDCMQQFQLPEEFIQ